MGPRKRGWALFSLVAALLAGSFAFTYWVLTQDAKRSEKSSDFSKFFAEPTPAPDGPTAALPETIPIEPRLTSAARLVRRVFYTRCGNEVVSEARVPAHLVGLTQGDVLSREKGAVIEEFTSNRVVLQETREAYCPRHSQGRYLGVSGGHLALFLGEPKEGAKPLEVFDLEVGVLPEREVQDLARGVPVSSESELQRVLQSYLEQAGF